MGRDNLIKTDTDRWAHPKLFQNPEGVGISNNYLKACKVPPVLTSDVKEILLERNHNREEVLCMPVK